MSKIYSVYMQQKTIFSNLENKRYVLKNFFFTHNTNTKHLYLPLM